MQTNSCITCSNSTLNPKFCSRSCAAKYNNKAFPKKKTVKKCIICDTLLTSYKNNRCEVHLQEYKEGLCKNKTIGEYRQHLSVLGKHPSYKHSHIRGLARSWLKHLTKEPCRHCGYDKHVELAHIKSVASFTDDTLLSVINSESNVIPLCPNCHWEFDNLERPQETASI